MLNITGVESDTGLSKDTLRVWERRYGFPQPLRDAKGERLYPSEQVERLRLIKRLLDAGARPGRVLALGLTELQQRSQLVPGAAPSAVEPALQSCLDQLRSHDAAALRQSLGHALLQLGLQGFVLERVVPLNRLVGAAWLHGELAVSAEHLYTEVIQNLLRAALSSIPAANPGQRPRVLLSTLPTESHGLGLLMAQVFFALEGAACLSLGTQTPLADLVRAVQAHGSDIVALSFSASQRAASVRAGLQTLRQRLPPATQLWVGGQCAALQRPAQEGIRVIGSLSLIATALAQWRAAQ